MSLSATGIFYFKSKLNEEALNDISFFIVQEATNHRLGILLGGNLPSWVQEKFSKLFHISLAVDGNSLIFNLAESAYYSNCDKLFQPIGINSTNPSDIKVDISRSSLPRIQHFFETVMKREEISHIRFDLELAFACPDEFVHRDCSPDQLCETIRQEYARNGNWDPTIQIIMKRISEMKESDINKHGE